MYTLSDFPILTDARWFTVQDKQGNKIRRFTVDKYEMDHVRAWREGYVAGLNGK